MDVYVQKGYWLMRKDVSKGFKSMLESLRMMQKNFPKMFPIPPEEKNNNFLVYTVNGSSEEIEKSARTIRCYIDFPFIMYYYLKSNPVDSKFIVNYMHTPYQELYEFYFDDSTENSWKLISKKPKQNSSFDELLPSQVADRENIHLPSNEEEFERVTHGKGGKWIVHCSNLETLDSFWKFLKPLYDGGILVGLKSRTAKSTTSEMSPTYRTKVVMCYTADADCKSSVKIAAEIISNCIRYKNIMYYKSNEASLSGKYRHEGKKLVSKYMYTDTGNFFERDDCNRWKAVYFNEEKQQRKFA